MLFQTLYSLLPAMLNTNPFTEEIQTPIGNGSSIVGMDDVISVFQKALEMFTEHHLHPQIMSQLFCYLFYFTSTTVFNSMMSKGKLYLRTNRGFLKSIFLLIGPIGRLIYWSHVMGWQTLNASVGIAFSFNETVSPTGNGVYFKLNFAVCRELQGHVLGNRAGLECPFIIVLYKLSA